MERILIIQTSFLGDLILATPLIRKLRKNMPDSEIDILVRKGNESLVLNNPNINDIIIWDKNNSKYANLYNIIKQIRKKNYTYIYNLQRFASTGLISFFSGAKYKIGYNKNPFSFCYTKSVKHDIGNGKHEVVRNLELTGYELKEEDKRPELFPDKEDFAKVNEYKKSEYICIAPASVWKTKEFPLEKWVELINKSSSRFLFILIGSKADKEKCKQIEQKVKDRKVITAAGQLSLLQTAALMNDAVMNYVNDSAPMHIASSMNAPVTAVFCSTIPGFGFGPLSDKSVIAEEKTGLSCRPCGLHGKSNCPEGHFNCANLISIEDLII